MPAVNDMAGAFVVRPGLVPSTLRLLDHEAEYFAAEAQTAPESEDGACYTELSDGLLSLATQIRAGQAVDLTSALETRAAGEWLIESGAKYEVQRAHEGSAEWDWRYLSDIAALAADIEQAFAA